MESYDYKLCIFKKVYYLLSSDQFVGCFSISTEIEDTNFKTLNIFTFKYTLPLISSVSLNKKYKPAEIASLISRGVGV